MTTAWIIGSYPDLPVQSVTIGGGGRTIAAGDYYLRDATASLSLLAAMVTAMTAGSVGSAAAYLGEDRKVHLAGSGTFSVTWPSDALLRGLLGFSGNLSGASSYTATSISKLLWSPGIDESPKGGILGSAGQRAYRIESTDWPQEITTTQLASGRSNTFSWQHVSYERYKYQEIGGEFGEFFDQVIVLARRWKLYRGVTESSATTAATLGTPLGPYKTPLKDGIIDEPFSRSSGFEHNDQYFDVDIAARTVAEYGS